MASEFPSSESACVRCSRRNRLLRCAHFPSPPSPPDYVVQGHRGNILQGVGCLPTTYNVTLAFPLFYMWPPLLSFVAVIYGMLSLRAFLKRRVVVEEFLNSNGSGLNADRYLRLMCFSAVELTFAFPLGLFVLLVQAVDKPVYPWISWEDTQSNFDRFDQLPALFFTSTSINTLVLGVELWVAPFLSLIFFIFFGLGREQINQYKRWFYTLLKPFGIKPPAPKPYGTDRRTWWQKLLRRPVSSTTTTGNGTGLTSSRGPTDSLPVFRHNVSNTGSYPEKPIPSARSRYPQTASLDASLAFDFDEKLETETDIDINGAKYHSEGTLDVGDVNKALPASPSIVITSLSAHGGGDSDHDDERDMSRTRSMLTTSSASSVAGSSRRVSAAIRDVEPSSEAEARAVEARVQRMA